jgi:hypothetical protein
MYNGWDKSGAHSDEWVTKTMTFLDCAFSLSKINKVWHPFRKFWNLMCFEKNKVVLDLCQNGFVLHYEVWLHHNKSVTQAIEEDEVDYSTGVDRMDEMLKVIQLGLNLDTEDPPTTEVEVFFKLLKASEEPLH